jgi:hypothetical protein
MVRWTRVLGLPLAALLVALPMALAAAQEGAGSDSGAALDALAERLRVEVIAPAHVALAEATDRLATAVEVYCAAPDAAALDDARTAFHAAADRWMEVQWVGFGPQTFLLRKTRMQFWPDTRNVTGRQLRQALDDQRGDLLDPATLAQASVALQGFPAVERLLFGDVRITDGTYACALTGAITRNMASIAQELGTAWSDPAQAGLPLPEGRDFVAEVYGSVAEQVTAMADRKLAAAVGETAADARPRLGEMWRSGRSLDNIDHNLIGIAAVARGGPEAERFIAVLQGPAGAPEVADDLAAALDRAQALADGLAGTPMAAAAEAGATRDDLVALTEAVRDLQTVWEGPVGTALDLRVGFNSMDGD